MPAKPPEIDISEAFAEFSKNADAMQKAMKAVAGPIREMSDMMKAINQNEKDVLDNAKKQREEEEKTTKEKRVQVDLETEILKVVTEVSMKKGELTAEGEKIRQQTIDVIKDQLAARDLISENSRAYAEQGLETRKHNEALAAQVPIWDKIGKAANSAYESMLRSNNLVSKAYATTSGSVNEVMFGRGTTTAEQAIGKIGSSMSSLIPTAGGIGGLLGVIMYGMKKDAEFAAIGESARQVFDKVGGGAEELGRKVSAASRDLSVRGIIDKAELANVAEGFANLGFRASEVDKPLEGFNYRINNLATATLSMDKALELPAGTMAKMSGTMSQMFNKSLDDSVRSLWNIGTAAEKSGANMATFMQQTLEAASALRMLNANGDAVGSLQLGLMQRYSTKGGGGYSDQVAQARAAAGTASAMQSIAGLDVGMSAVIGERLGNKGSGLDAWYAMKGGDARSGGSNLKIEDIVQEMAKLATETTDSRSEQVYMLMQLTGASKEGAEAILDANNEMASDGKMSAESIKKMNEGFQTEGQKTSRIVVAIEKIKDGFAHIGSGMLIVIVETLKMIYHSIMALGGTMMTMNPFASASERAAGYTMKWKHGNAADAAAANIPAGTKRVEDGLNEIFGKNGGARDLYGMTNIGTGWSVAGNGLDGLTPEQKAQILKLKAEADMEAGVGAPANAQRAVVKQTNRGMAAGMTGGMSQVIFNLKDAIEGIIEYMGSNPNKQFKEGK